MPSIELTEEDIVDLQVMFRKELEEIRREVLDVRGWLLDEEKRTEVMDEIERRMNRTMQLLRKISPDSVPDGY